MQEFQEKPLTNSVRMVIIQKLFDAANRIWGYSSAGRALEWHSRGQRFDPAYLHHLVLKTIGFQDFFFCNSGISPVLGWFFNHPATWHFRATRQHESNMNQDDFTNWSTRAWVSPWRFEKASSKRLIASCRACSRGCAYTSLIISVSACPTMLVMVMGSTPSATR